MPTWNELLNDFEARNEQTGRTWLGDTIDEQIQALAQARDSNVLVYASAFLQKPGADFAAISITHEDLNGVMPTIHGMDWNKKLTLVLHTPGGDAGAAEAIVSYLRSKFSVIEAIVPTIAMSAGTMIALGADEIVMGRQSQLGPIDPQIYVPALGRYVASGSVIDQFKTAADEILSNPSRAHIWAPITQTLGYGFLQDAENTLRYARSMVTKWLAANSLMSPTAGLTAEEIAKWFADGKEHNSHGARIDREAVRSKGLRVAELEDPQELQECVLTLYHLLTLVFEQTNVAKAIVSSNGTRWIKQLV